MQKYISTIFLFSILFSIFGPIFPAIAAEFNPNYLISDEEMQSYQSMTRADIDLFLHEKNSYLYTYRIEDKDGKKLRASDIIYRAAQEYKINPKYILVKLQKEQSLISAKNPSQKQLDWATGYAICDACSMDDPRLQKWRGFGNQVDSAAGIIRWYYDNKREQNWIKTAGETYVIDGTEVTPQNDATGFLYTYTPHIQGNQNFWNLWQKWFETGYPDGTVFRSQDEATVYLLQEGKKRAFKSMTALITRVDPKRILTVPASEIKRYPEGAPITFPNFSILKAGSKYYLLEYDTLRPFESATTVQKIGYNPDEILEVTTDDIAAMPVGSTITLENSGSNPIGEIIFVKETQSSYFVKEGIAQAIIDPQIAKIAYPSIKSRVGTLAELEKTTAGDPLIFPDGTLIKVPTSPKVYVLEHGKKRYIANEHMFVSLGYKWENILVTTELVSTLLPLGSAIALPDSLTNDESGDSNGTPSQSTPSKNTPSTPATPAVPKVSDAVTLGKDGLPQFVDTGVMYGVSENDSVYIDTKFDTTINTYLIADAKSGEILAGKNVDVPRPLASFTKVLTADILMRDGLAMNRTVTYHAAEHKGLYGSYRLAEGEKVRNSDILTTMLVSSNNSATRMIVDGLQKDEAKFVSEMNAYAKTLGLKKTRFTDPSGADLGNFGTAREYLKIFQEAIKNSTILSTLAMESYSYDELVDKDNNPTHFDSNTNFLMKKSDLPYTIVASKTGYLIESGSGLVMLVERKSDHKRFIIVSMGNPDYEQRFTDADALTRWALKSF